MKTFIIHANQSVTLKSVHGWWPVETLRSRPTLSIRAERFDDAMRQAHEDVRARYQSEDVEVLDVNVTAELVKELNA